MYFTLTSVLPYFEGFKLALFNVIFYPKFSQKSSYYTQPSLASPFYNNHRIGNFMVPDSNYQTLITDVGSYRQTERGLFDLSGNVSEWTRDTISEKLITDAFQNFYRKILGDVEDIKNIFIDFYIMKQSILSTFNIKSRYIDIIIFLI